jgi:hypothetical protein
VELELADKAVLRPGNSGARSSYIACNSSGPLLPVVERCTENHKIKIDKQATRKEPLRWGGLWVGGGGGYKMQICKILLFGRDLADQ